MNKFIKRHLLLFSVIVMIAIFSVSVIAAETDAQGSCGKGVQWSYADGTLTVSGNGAMTSFSTVTAQPWYRYKNDIVKVVIENGVTSVGRCAFYGFDAITEVVLPDTLIKIEEYAFFSCKGVKGMAIPEGVEFIGQYAIRKSGITVWEFVDANGWTFSDGTEYNGSVSAFKTDATYKLDCVKKGNGIGTVVASGRFYSNTFAWTLDDNGVLTVTGEGDMPKLSATTIPWYN